MPPNRKVLDLDSRMALGPREAAEVLGVSETTLRRYMTTEGLPYSRVNGRIFILVRKLLAWVEQHEEQPEEEVDRVLALVDKRQLGVEG